MVVVALAEELMLGELRRKEGAGQPEACCYGDDDLEVILDVGLAAAVEALSEEL